MLTAVLIVWRRDLRAVVRLLAWQGLALAAIPLLRGAHDGEVALIYVGITILALRAVALPWLLARALAAEQRDQREATPLVNTASSLLITAVLTMAAFAITRPLVNLEPSAAATAVPAAFAVVFIALFVMVTRRHAISQAAGFLMLDNGIAATAFLLTAGVPLIVELGASLDVLFAVIVIGVLTGRLRRAFGGADLDQLQRVARLMTALLLAAILAPVTASIATLIGGWRRSTATLTVASAMTVLGCGAALGFARGLRPAFRVGRAAARRRAHGHHADRHRAGRHAEHLGGHRLHRHRTRPRPHRRLRRPVVRGAHARVPGRDGRGGVRQQHRRDLGRDRGHHRDHGVPRRASPHPHRAGSDMEVCHRLLGRYRDGLPGHGVAVLRRPARGRTRRTRAGPRRSRHPRRRPGPGGDPASRWPAADRIRRQGRPVPVSHLAGRRAQPGPCTGECVDERGAALGGVLGVDPDQTDHRAPPPDPASYAPGCW